MKKNRPKETDKYWELYHRNVYDKPESMKITENREHEVGMYRKQ